MLIDTCEQNGVDHQFVKTVEERTGNAIIQVSAKGQNSIVLFAGANRQNDRAFVDEVLSHFGEGDLLLLQNEINLVDYLIDRGFEKGMVIALNPSPFDDEMRPFQSYDLFDERGRRGTDNRRKGTGENSDGVQKTISAVARCSDAWESRRCLSGCAADMPPWYL